MLAHRKQRGCKGRQWEEGRQADGPGEVALLDQLTRAVSDGAHTGSSITVDRTVAPRVGTSPSPGLHLPPKALRICCRAVGQLVEALR
jgi:hypothetical protein